MEVDRSISTTKSTIQIFFLNFCETINEISSVDPASQHLLKHPLLQGFFLPCCRVLLQLSKDFCKECCIVGLAGIACVLALTVPTGNHNAGVLPVWKRPVEAIMPGSELQWARISSALNQRAAPNRPPISSTTGPSSRCVKMPNASYCMRYHKLWVHPQACFLYCCFRDGSHFFCTFDVKNRVRAVKKHHHQNLILYRFNCVSGKLLTKREICQQVMDCHVKSLIITNLYFVSVLINRYA